MINEYGLASEVATEVDVQLIFEPVNLVLHHAEVVEYLFELVVEHLVAVILILTVDLNSLELLVNVVILIQVLCQ